MQRRFVCALAVLLLAPGLSPVRAADKVDLKNLLPQMTDLSLLAEYPDPPYVARQFSSYDRASEAPGSESWFANGDRGFMLYDGVLKEETPYFKHGPKQAKPDGHFAAGSRVGISPTHRPVGGFVWAYVTAPDGSAEGGKVPQGYIAQSAIAMDPQGHVLAEMDVPGCVVNIWSANPKDGGKIRIYLDGAEKPVIEASLQALLGGKWKTTIDGKETIPFPDPLSCERSRGFNLYFPIAYARHCKITVDRQRHLLSRRLPDLPGGYGSRDVQTRRYGETVAGSPQRDRRLESETPSDSGKEGLVCEGSPEPGSGRFRPSHVRRASGDQVLFSKTSRRPRTSPRRGVAQPAPDDHF